jgi:hypothetical protein
VVHSFLAAFGSPAPQIAPLKQWISYVLYNLVIYVLLILLCLLLPFYISFTKTVWSLCTVTFSVISKIHFLGSFCQRDIISNLCLKLRLRVDRFLYPVHAFDHHIGEVKTPRPLFSKLVRQNCACNGTSSAAVGSS